ncbi:redoxin domain-containing protein [Oceanobacillus halotolerans]|uniref:redoxin domain-containing protein n=1 Tax=Oceanobacillus halotolerans TaxID=2663380 RepID=UPI0013DBEF03|nr:redoxin domain-containing protein [Oceanobacillus halotolerans]
MKQIIVGLLLLGMFAWAIYEFVGQSNENEMVAPESEAEPNQDEEVDSSQDPANAEVGLEKGNLAPDFELTTLDDETVKLSDFRGERVMLNFWASWCGPCRAEMPDMQQFYEDKDVIILAVNLTDTETEMSDVTNFVDEYSLTFPILLDEETEVADLYRIQPIPTSYLIDSNGIIHNVAFGALNYELMVKEFEQMQ